MRKSVFILGLLAASLSYAQVDPNRVICVVNGEEIKGGEYYRRMEFMPGVGKMYTGGFVESPPGFLTIEQLITERLIFQLAKEKGVLPTDAEVDAEIKTATGETPKMIEEWQAGGRTMAELAYQTRYNLAQFKLITIGITVTDAEVDKFYAEHPTLFTVSKQVTLKIIAVNTDDRQTAVDAALKAGQKFEDVAKQYSLDVGGSDFGTRSFDELSEPARKALETLKEGDTTGWITNGTTRAKFMVAKWIPPTKRPLDAALKRSIRREQMMAQGRVKNDLQQQMTAMRRRSTIDIKEKSFSDSYKKFIETYLGGG